ncbi:LANO_0C01640g1_1 [Lachancea nothofagi CBS 11611]|uniref:LANO_0C01640g1_1 n=1 Tax=Lachancea nothofagi CBS 11611 TaxID=1266666 RepID=A0A1G4J490_9SACH|nr:LANO_0C01640g1_1 [Lachancea nothofagi CBS 11611]
MRRACSRCRKHKIKCAHNGQPPCSYCSQRNLDDECELSFPEYKKPEKSYEQSKNEFKVSKPNLTNEIPVPLAFTTEVRPSMKTLCEPIHIAQPETQAALSSSTIFDIVPLIPAYVIRDAILRMCGSFPELTFFHLPTALERPDSLHPVLVGAILSHTSFFDPYKDSNGRLSSDQWLGVSCYQVTHCVYENLTLQTVFNNYQFLLEPSIDVARALLILCVVKWGHNEYYAAWMLHGCGARMVQSLNFDESFNSRSKQYPLLRKIKARAYWCAFVLDKIICTGQNKCFALSEFSDIPLPVDDNEFSFPAFDYRQQEKLKYKVGFNLTLNNFLEQCRDNPDLVRELPFTVYVYLWSLWGKLNRRTMRPDRESLELECPWDSTTEAYKFLREIDELWSLLPNEWKWSKDKYLRYDPPIVRDNLMITMNCLYHISIAFFNREFLPFLPYDVERPVGPPDTNFPSRPNNDYWIESARSCFRSARDLSLLLGTLLKEETDRPVGAPFRNSVLVSPFYSFVAFTCGVVTTYGANFHWMDPDNALYKEDSDNPANLRNCYNVTVKILKAKEDDFMATKNWLGAVLKIDEINRFVAQNREKAKHLDGDRKRSKDLKRSLIEPNVDAKHIEKMFPILPPPRPSRQHSVEHMYPSPTADSYYTKVGLFPHQKDGEGRALYHSNLQPRFISPAIRAHSSQYGFPTNALDLSYSRPSSSVLPPATACAPSPNFFPTQQPQIPGLGGLTEHPNVPSPFPHKTPVNPAQGSAFLKSFTHFPYGNHHHSCQRSRKGTHVSETMHTTPNEIRVELDTDKLNLFFNDHELDLLQQFKG